MNRVLATLRLDARLQARYWVFAIVLGAAMALAASLWLFLYTWTGVHTYWLHPRRLPLERQNRAVALGYYACAPLVVLPAALVVALVGAGLWDMADQTRSRVLEVIAIVVYVIAWILLPVILYGYWRVCLSMTRLLAQREAQGQAVVALALPVLWLLLAGVFFVLAPAMLAYTWLIIYAL